MYEPSNQSVVSSICHNVVYIVSLKLYQSTGIYNYEEYLLARDRDETDRERTNTLKRSTGHHHHTGTLMRDQEKMEKLKRKLHTDDDMEWLNPSQSLRQQGVDEKEILLLKRRYFFSDMNVDARDPVQLNLLYVQVCYCFLNNLFLFIIKKWFTLSHETSEI
ncbi:unnamed protein product [Schistosoma curassoni]|uniref:FERM domain-containing protein n=1 Tax=Schistosoma curassoni TaxID=6186 RepID=A0A183KUB1_9TREM|nr:unnamed protein product [Schistosoma curassoni]